MAITSARGKSFRWPMKWTACGLGSIALCFLIGMAVAGAAHQIAWIAQNEESLYENSFKKFEPYHHMREIGVLIAESLNDSHSVASFRTNVSAYISEEHRLSADRFHILMLADSGGGIEGVLVFPRDPQDRKRFGAELTTSTTNSMRIEPRDLQNFIDGNANKFVAF